MFCNQTSLTTKTETSFLPLDFIKPKIARQRAPALIKKNDSPTLLREIEFNFQFKKKRQPNYSYRFSIF